MKFSILFALIGLLVSVVLDGYLLRRLMITLRTLRRPLAIAYLGVTFIEYASMITAIAIPVANASDGVFLVLMWLIFIFLSIFCSKLVLVIADLVARLYRKIRRKPSAGISKITVAISCVVFLALWWGALINRNRISVVECELSYSDLPIGFDGYKIVQISDFHVGTWGSDTAFVARVVDRINALNPDLIVFTGDIVNRKSEELEPMISPLTRLKAKDGLYAVMGNHDYGDYVRWDSDSAHMADRQNLRHLYSMTSFHVLDNTHEFIYRGGDSIAVVGVENIGEPPFATYGSLEAAYPDLSDSVFKLLLSHNPRHWMRDISGHTDKNIALTLAGHTHAMQIQIAGHSPASLKYDTDWGLFTDSRGQNLYVNRGLGTVGLPMRLGATPEITLFTLSVK